MRSHSKDARPYVRDVVDMPQGAAGKATITVVFVLLALAMGFVVGFAVFLAMNLSTWLTELLWGLSGSFALFPLVTCTVGGALIGVWTWWSNDRVHSLEEVMREFKTTGSFRTNGIWKPVVTFLLPLVFGGSIGFEAGLTGLITSACCWIRDQLKKAGLRLGSIADVTFAATMAAIFRTPLAGIVAGAESAGELEGEPVERDPRDYNLRRSVKAVLYTAAAFGAFGGIKACSALFGVSGGLPRFGEIEAAATDFLWVVPCIAVAYLMTLAFHAANRSFSGISTAMGGGTVSTIAKPVIAGVAMGAVACALPYVLFPGEAQSEELMESWTAFTAVALLATGVLKAVVTPLCINMGWVGGDFFPSIFAGVAAGYGLAALTGADPMLMVTVTTTAFLAGVLRKPLLVLAILFMCFPADGIVWMGVAAVVGATLPVPQALLGSRE